MAEKIRRIAVEEQCRLGEAHAPHDWTPHWAQWPEGVVLHCSGCGWAKARRLLRKKYHGNG